MSYNFYVNKAKVAKGDFVIDPLDKSERCTASFRGEDIDDHKEDNDRILKMNRIKKRISNCKMNTQNTKNENKVTYNFIPKTESGNKINKLTFGKKGEYSNINNNMDNNSGNNYLKYYKDNSENKENYLKGVSKCKEENYKISNENSYRSQFQEEEKCTKENKLNYLSNLNQNCNINQNYNYVDEIPTTNIISPQNKHIPIMSSSNFSFEKLIRKSNSMFSILSSKEITPIDINLVNKESNLNYVPEKTIDRDFSKLNKSIKFNNKKTNANLYLDKRHLIEVERLNNLRYEKICKEDSEIRDRPEISKFSKDINKKNFYKNHNSVFDRLTDKSRLIKKQEEINNIVKVNYADKFRHTPKINEISKRCHRDLNDLLEWKNKRDEKTEIERNKKHINFKTNPNIDPISEEILRELSPRYLKMKVEDRLLEKGQKSKIKIEEMKEEIYNQITRSKSFKKMPIKNIPTSRNNEAQDVNDLNYLTKNDGNDSTPRKTYQSQPSNRELNSYNKSEPHTPSFHGYTPTLSSRKKENNNQPQISTRTVKSVEKDKIKHKILDVRTNLHNYLNNKMVENNCNSENSCYTLKNNDNIQTNSNNSNLKRLIPHYPQNHKYIDNNYIQENIYKINTSRQNPSSQYPSAPINNYKMNDYMKLNDATKEFLNKKLNNLN